jgi:hypothetical protein
MDGRDATRGGGITRIDARQYQHGVGETTLKRDWQRAGAGTNPPAGPYQRPYRFFTQFFAPRTGLERSYSYSRQLRASIRSALRIVCTSSTARLASNDPGPTPASSKLPPRAR